MDHVIPVAQLYKNLLTQGSLGVKGMDILLSKVYDEANLQCLCRGCHFKKSAAENRAKSSSPEIEAWQQLMEDK